MSAPTLALPAAQQEAAQIEAALDHARAVAAIYWQAERELLRVVSEALAKREGEPEYAGPRFAEVRALRREADQIVRRLERLSERLVTDGVNAAWRRGAQRATGDLERLGSRKGIPQGQGVIEIARRATRLVASTQPGMRSAPEFLFQQIVNQVAAQALTGAITRRQAQARLLDQVARRGITGFTDTSGRVWSASAYAEMATRTAMAQAATDGHLATLAANGIDLVIVSRLPFTCARCAVWEGTVLSQEGPIGWRREESAVSDDLVDVLVEGTVTQARAAGLLHPGCGHTLGAYLPGVTRPPRPAMHPAGPDGYRASQKMRRLESELRAANRQAAVALDADQRRKAAARADRLTHQIRDHAKTSGIPARADRVRQETIPRDLDQRTDEELAGLLGRWADDEAAVARITDVLEQRDRDRDRQRDERVREAVADLPPEFANAGDDQVLELVRRFSDEGDPVALERLLEALDAREQNPTWSWRSDDTAEERAVTDLIADGIDPMDAYGQVYGVDPEQMRRQDSRAHAEAQRRPGETLDQVVRRLYDEWLELQFIAAERYARGVLTNAAGRAAGIDGRTLLSGPQSRADKYASEELRAWWEQHPRMTLVEFRAQMLGRASDRKAAQRAKEQRR
ncbi:phage minor capsid protein [Nonomuraea wenchangensis]|uniref:Phage minor capsid protein 2 n=1 Tax=Nonomuraea wenchangensis TaxID=568860 RepID=A0A1I0LTY5_9ACTN|nr:phage minor capsid protein [Nonomuraea wenchangensis]SEU46588.1 Phage minor capsid protein 2 [Nonomuraea wenchangensis]